MHQPLYGRPTSACLWSLATLYPRLSLARQWLSRESGHRQRLNSGISTVRCKRQGGMHLYREAGAHASSYSPSSRRSNPLVRVSACRVDGSARQQVHIGLPSELPKVKGTQPSRLRSCAALRLVILYQRFLQVLMYLLHVPLSVRQCCPL